MSADVTAIIIKVILGLGLVATVASLVFLRSTFARFVGFRYLLRARRSRAANLGMVVSAAITGAGLITLFAARGHTRSLETLGVIASLLGALVLLLFVLLGMFSVFTTVCTFGVVLGVGSLVVVLAVTSGFEREFENKVLAVNAHLLVVNISEPTLETRERAADEYLAKLKGLPGLRKLAKFSMSTGEVMVGRVGANLKGVDPRSGAEELRASMVAGTADDLWKPARCPGVGEQMGGPTGAEWVGRVVLGAELGHRLRAKVGDCISLLVPFSGADIASAPTGFMFKVVGLFRLGFHEFDTRLAYTSLEDARHMARARLPLFGVELHFHDPRRALTVEPEVVARVGYEPRVMDWETLNHNLFTALETQKLLISLCLMIIILVAAFNILASLTIIVMSKTREMAILSTIGARRRTLMRLFVVAGSLVGFVGIGLGVLYGLAVCGLASIYGYALDPKVYTIARLPVDVSGTEILFVAASTQLVCVLAAIYPAVRASRLKVVDGLRFT